MRALRASVLAVCIALPGAGTGVAAAPRDTLLVNAAWLAHHIADKDLVVLHVSSKRTYDAGHIPGARFVDHSDLCPDDRAAGNNLQMPPADALRTKLAALGISDSSRVVVYFAQEWVSPATRVVFTLDYAGLKNVALLDGGVGAWTREGQSLSTQVPEVTVGTLAPLRTKPIVVDAAFVKAHLDSPGYAIVDARGAIFYDGAQAGGGMDSPHRPGHIAGARSVPFNSVVDSTLRFKPDADIAALFATAGVQPGDTIVGYCHLGQQATAMLLAARLAGRNVMLYDGSFEDWSRHADYPVEKPSAKKP